MMRFVEGAIVGAVVAVYVSRYAWAQLAIDIVFKVGRDHGYVPNPRTGEVLRFEAKP